MKKGFTLIELLIVVSIIGILAVALIPSLTDAPARARDAGRVASVNEVVAAVESFNIDKGNYPPGEFCLDPETSCATPTAGSAADFICNYLSNDPPEANTAGKELGTEGATVADTTAGQVGCDDWTNSYIEYKKDGSGYEVGTLLEAGSNNYHIIERN